MDNELRKTLDVKLNINIDGTAAFGIVLASITGLCFCFSLTHILRIEHPDILLSDKNFF